MAKRLICGALRCSRAGGGGGRCAGRGCGWRRGGRLWGGRLGGGWRGGGRRGGGRLWSGRRGGGRLGGGAGGRPVVPGPRGRSAAPGAVTRLRRAVRRVRSGGIACRCGRIGGAWARCCRGRVVEGGGKGPIGGHAKPPMWVLSRWGIMGA
ncbi:hypothetical protein CNX65_20310 [Actinosynnema pretiosum]|uniref:Uncharacterized protein n=1 Tax=Actinosynnema pretiosum TaxID=42197 RepID=A0A290Z8P0_9PSEU|nr:hypothetical protein CNX65_20310 [Actinosynnema pretiosum]